MNRADQKELGRYVRWMGDELSLRDWTFNLYYKIDDPEEQDSYAICFPTYGRKHTDIHFCTDFRDLKPEAQRHTVVHELLHCHFAAAQEFVRVELGRHLGQGAYNIFMGAYRQSQEYGIDGVTEAIAKKYPLIDWPKEKK
jgi:hypothetical protein